MTTRAIIFRFLPGLVGGLTLALLALGAPAGAYHTNFQANCNDTWWNHDSISRGQARDYAFVAAGEGYQWGGGCWNGNNVDDSPGDPPEVGNTRGEGPDCSGFTFKAWWERAEWNDPWFRYHTWMQNVHGPYTAVDFKYGNGAPNETVAKGNTVFMDAFASDHHIGMIYWANTAYNQDRIIEAKCEACGTGTWPRTYRGQPEYSGVRRLYWAPY
jgi:hypothetical protein